jgi:2-dehydro-3-deoxyphosphogluconate aldolase / (4S)-4-hydroxy-2-oxoglutarate aldolase
MNDKQAVLQAIRKQGMLPLFYNDDAVVSYEVVRTLYRAGVRAIEYTNRGAAALQNFKHMKAQVQAEMPELALGVGTVKWKSEAIDFIHAGADFVVAPIINDEVATVVNDTGLLWIPGCMTPTEISVAQKHQALLIKLFPAQLLTPNFVSAIKELFPGQLFVPTGSIELEKEAVKAWFDAGVCAVGMGSKLISKKIVAERLYVKLYQDTVAALALIRDARQTSTAG